MRVTRLEIFGFKSFMDRLNLPLTGGITGVVGPNGCGKSNIVDALKWVLGETNARNLRGSISEDVIFNGTETLRPLGLAEVTLTFRSAGDSFVGDLVSDALEAEEISEEEQDGELVASEASDDKGDQFDSKAITDQTGSFQAIEDQTAENSSELLEGSSRPHLTVIDGNLDREPSVESADIAVADNTQVDNTIGARFAWLKSVNEVQVTRRLYRSGESEYFINRVPCRLKDIVELLRAVGLGPRSYTVVAQGQVSRIISAKPEERRLILEEAAGVVGFRDKIATTTRRLKETDLGLSRINDIIKEVSRQVASLKRQASRAENREELRSELRRLERSVYADQLRCLSVQSEEKHTALSKFRSSEESALAAVHGVQAQEEQARASLIALDVQSDQIRASIDQIREELSTREHQRGSRAARLVELRATNASKTIEQERVALTLQELGERRELASRALETLEFKEKELAEAVAKLESAGDQSLRAISAEVQELRRAVEEGRRELQGLQAKALENEVLQRTLREQLEALAPVELAEGEKRELFVDGLNVPAKYTVAIQALLGDCGGYVLDNNLFGSARSWNDSENRSTGLIRPGTALSGGGTAALIGGVHAALSLIEANDASGLGASHLLRNCYVADSIESAERFLLTQPVETRSDIKVSTLNGIIITEHTVAKIAGGGALRIKARIEELVATSIVLSQEIERVIETGDGIKAKLQQAEEKQAVELKEAEKRALEVRSLSQELGSARGRLGAEKAAVSHIDTDLRRLEAQANELDRLITSNRNEESSIESQIAADEPVDESALRESILEYTRDLTALMQKRDHEREELSKQSHKLNDAREILDQSRAALSGLNLEIQKIDLELEHTCSRISELLGDEMLAELKCSDDTALLSDEDRHTFREDIERIRRRIEREGEVDSSSIEKFREESSRLEELEQQHRDLEKAAETLKRTIKRLSKISETRFVNTFEAVNKNFNELIPRLFGGGSGKLELLDPAHPLESGVEIVARPPGKKLKSIELMSGGEKALCAIALIVSMFLQRPSPLCVLDEVDAPLDDANVNRFLSLVREMSAQTQFLMITHNKQSMAISDQLVGVTMEKPGASTVVTVSLQEASRYAANA